MKTQKTFFTIVFTKAKVMSHTQLQFVKKYLKFHVNLIEPFSSMAH